MAEAPKRKTATKADVDDKPKKAVLKVGMAAEYNGVLAAITGIDKRNAKVYLDSPVCKWVEMADCKKA